MSEGADTDSKTEQPTERRIADALEKGNKPFSMEAVTLGSLLSILCVTGLIASDSVGQLALLLKLFLAQAGTLSLSSNADAMAVLESLVSVAGLVTLPTVLVLALGGLIGSLAQNQPGAAWDRVTPKLSRLSPQAQAKILFGKEGLIRFSSIVLKSVIVCSIAAYILAGQFDSVLLAALGDVSRLPFIVSETVLAILLPLCFAALLIAIADTLWVRFKWNKGLMMTKQEVKDEMKQSEGDSQVKQRFKILGRQRLNKRMMSDVPRATFAVVNPTHYAIAMHYVASEGGAPVVLAKGVDHMALRIRGKCEESGVPLVEDKALARGLYASADVGDMIPVEFYRAVAEVIHYVEMRKKINVSRS
jgi:flagellar biosynthesis protein FlhB